MKDLLVCDGEGLAVRGTIGGAIEQTEKLGAIVPD
jgi:hypothetical protein